MAWWLRHWTLTWLTVVQVPEMAACFLAFPLSLSGENMCLVGPAIRVTTMSLDSHVVDRGLSTGPGGLNSRQAHVHMRRGEGVAAWPSPLGGVISHFQSLCLCLSGKCMCPIAETSQNKTKQKTCHAAHLHKA